MVQKSLKIGGLLDLYREVMHNKYQMNVVFFLLVTLTM